MNIQEIFNKIVTHLREQNCKSYDPNRASCMYRGPNGTKCAVGCLIPDEIYSREMEGRNFQFLVLATDLFDSIPWLKDAKKTNSIEEVEDYLRLIQILQRVHDNIPVEKWETQFMLLAQRFNLALPPKIES